MLKKSDREHEELRLYYSNIKILLNINELLIYENPDKEIVKVRRN